MIVRARRVIEAWESEGGARTAPLSAPAVPLKGTPSQVQWAERIRTLVDAEFDRVRSSFRAIALKQSGGKRADIGEVIALSKRNALR